MNNIINILMNRDGYSLEEAKDIFNEVKDQVDEIIANSGDYDEVEELLMDELGIEMDYIFDII